MALKGLIVLAGEAAGEQMGLQKPETSEDGGLVTYLTHLALEHPVSFAALLGKVMTIQQRDKARGRTNNYEDRVVTIKIGYFPDTPQQEVIEPQLIRPLTRNLRSTSSQSSSRTAF